MNGDNKIDLDRQLLRAAATGNDRIAKAALESGADLYSVNRNGLSVVRRAVDKGSLPTVYVLFQHGLSCSHPQVRDAYFKACELGHVQIVNEFLQQGMDKNAFNGANHCGLMLAAINNRVGLVKFLIENGADIELCDINKQTPLIMAAISGHTGIVKALVEAGAKLEARTPFGNTPLKMAVANGRLETVKYLISVGANLYVEDSKGRTIFNSLAGGKFPDVRLYLESYLEERELEKLVSGECRQAELLEF